MFEHEIACVVDVPYDFTDNDGKHVSGVTTKAAVITFENGNVKRFDIVKCARDYKPPVRTRGVLTFDMYQRAAGFIPASK